MEPTTHPLPLLDATAGGCSCGCGTATTKSDQRTTSKGSEVAIQTFSVTGMTCGHCEQSVATELQALEGVNEVSIDLVAGGTSSVTVTSTQPLDEAQVAAALDEAGDYQLA